ncbi:hypothetical protein [Streptomyces sp. NPDC005799]|uniref:hypothetical protein n=1 Tax=Streptomyces sp. NPDC005799 TaxID=3154678 RepID=UPI0033E75EC6
MLNATPYVRAHVTPGWEDTAFVLPVVVDLAFVGSLRADEIASRYGASGGVWAGLLRLFTGAASLFLNVGHSAENGDWTGVAQHLIAPGILVLVAEAGPAYRRRLSNRLTEVELEEAARAETARKEQDQEDERKRKLAQERAEADRIRQQRREDQVFALDLEEKREAARATRELQSRRLDLEDKRLTPTAVPAVHSSVDGTTAHRYNGTTAHGVLAPQPEPRPAPVNGHAPAPVPAAPVRVPVAPVVSAPRTGVLAPQARTRADNGPAVVPTADPRATAADRTATAPVPSPAPRTTDSAAFARPAGPAPAPVAAAQTGPARVTASVDEHQERPAPPAGPVKDWNLPGLPETCAPGSAPVLLTEVQVAARIGYGLTLEWTQRRIGEFAGRSATVVNRRKKERERAV